MYICTLKDKVQLKNIFLLFHHYKKIVNDIKISYLWTTSTIWFIVWSVEIDALEPKNIVEYDGKITKYFWNVRHVCSYIFSPIFI